MSWDYFSNGGLHASAIRNGELWNWGNNSGGQLGLNSTAFRSSPVQVGTLTNWASVGNGYTHTLAVKTDGTLWAWGTNTSGELGNGTIISRSSPVQIGTETNWSSVSHQANSVTQRIKTDGTLWGWGANPNGQLGIGVATNRSSPVQVGTRLWNYVAHNGNSGTFAVRNDGTIWSWGNNPSGELALNDTINRSSPVQIATESNWSRLAYPQNRPNNTSFAFKDNGSVYVINGTHTDQAVAGISFYKSSPAQVTSTITWKSVNAGTSFTIAISNSGSIWAWGTEANGVL